MVHDRRSRPAYGRHAAHRLLGLSSTASSREAKQQFRRLAHRLHPDRGGDPAAFRRLLDARAALESSGTRRRIARPPLIVVHRGPWWRRLPRALARAVRTRLNPPPPRVR